MKRHLIWILLTCIAITSSAHAQRYFGKRIHYSSGTGFFVSSYGHVVTNEHVIRDCKPDSIKLEGAYNGTAKILAADSHYDLALLNASQHAPSVGKLLATQRTIQPGDKVMLMGYPGGGNGRGQHVIALAQVINTAGPQGEPHWLQFTSSAQKGNSGGPLLDSSGNVIGVITGKTELFVVDPYTQRPESVRKTDVAVSLPILKAFLDQNHVRYQQSESLVFRSNDYTESLARRFIVKVNCVTGEEPFTTNRPLH